MLAKDADRKGSRVILKNMKIKELELYCLEISASSLAKQ